MLEFTLAPGELLQYEELKRDLIRYIRDGIHDGLDRHEAPTHIAERIVNTPVMKHLADLDALHEVYSPWPPDIKREEYYRILERRRTSKCLECNKEYIKESQKQFFCSRRCAKKWAKTGF